MDYYIVLGPLIDLLYLTSNYTIVLKASIKAF